MSPAAARAAVKARATNRKPIHMEGVEDLAEEVSRGARQIRILLKEAIKRLADITDPAAVTCADIEAVECFVIHACSLTDIIEGCGIDILAQVERGAA